MLWHLKNGVLDHLNPKVWLILIGSNDMFVNFCTDRFVLADILNVLKYLQTSRPEAQFIVHGILPRLDPVPESKGQTKGLLGRYWKRSQVINAQLKRFCETHNHLHFMQAGSFFLEETDLKGRRRINATLMEDGIHPTVEGLRVWGQKIAEMVNKTIKEAKK